MYTWPFFIKRGTLASKFDHISPLTYAYNREESNHSPICSLQLVGSFPLFNDKAKSRRPPVRSHDHCTSWKLILHSKCLSSPQDTHAQAVEASSRPFPAARGSKVCPLCRRPPIMAGETVTTHLYHLPYPVSPAKCPLCRYNKLRCTKQRKRRKIAGDTSSTLNDEFRS